MATFGFGAASTPASDRRTMFIKSLNNLNDQFLQWVKQQDKSEVWTDGIEDYVSYANQLLKEYDDVINSKSDAPKPATGAFNFGSTTNQPSAPTSLFNFAPTTSTPTFGFGAAPAQPATQENAEDDAEDEEEADDGPSLELESDNADILLSQRVGLLTSIDQKWKDRGTGLLTIRQSKQPSASGQKVVYIVFTTDTGRVLINASLIKGLKALSNPKNKKAVIMFLKSQIEGKEEAYNHFFRCGSEDAAKELLAKINEFV